LPGQPLGMPYGNSSSRHGYRNRYNADPIFEEQRPCRISCLSERIAIESYGEILRYIGNDDPTTRAMIEVIMAKEEEHAEDMKTLLASIEKK
jgi:rubrerythrin